MLLNNFNPVSTPLCSLRLSLNELAKGLWRKKHGNKLHNTVQRGVRIVTCRGKRIYCKVTKTSTKWSITFIYCVYIKPGPVMVDFIRQNLAWIRTLFGYYFFYLFLYWKWRHCARPKFRSIILHCTTSLSLSCENRVLTIQGDSVRWKSKLVIINQKKEHSDCGVW